MRKVRVLTSSPRIRAVGPEEWKMTASEEQALILRYKHRCDDTWYAELLEELSLEGKRLNPSRARRLLLAALRKGESVDGD